ncbi:MAG: amidohydrolase family protein [Saprospiraceae bacterium]|nr:amidohydrolase family protein [Saprospiraceae bacterium]
MRKLIADIIHTGDQGFVSDQVLLVEDSGKILDLQPKSEFNIQECEYYPGALVPGFINAHCHLELSHLKGQFESGHKLIPFLKSVVQNREVDQELVLEKIAEADAEMYHGGIVAVGDISNKTDTIDTKTKSQILYHSFIEAFDFLQEHLADKFFEDYKKVFDAFGNLPKTMVPHAPYSVSNRLFQRLIESNQQNKFPISIHNQETIDEDLLFLNKTGGFIDFWESFGFSLDTFQATGKESIYYAMDRMDAIPNTLFIHNTQMKKQHLEDVLKWNPNAYFVTCPNANLFIENTLPEYSNFNIEGTKLCIGTDSLSSNWQLSILEEIKTILKFNAKLNLENVLRWANYHGALALNLDSKYGSFTKGKEPGIVWIQAVEKRQNIWTLGSHPSVKRIL